jgi:hypothetical protein
MGAMARAMVTTRTAWALCVLALPLAAEEGMWPFNQFPKDAVNQKYAFDATAEFLDNLRLASVKIGAGAGSFVSPAGLLLTTQKVAAGCLARLSSRQHDDLRDGFYAESQSSEAACPGLRAEVLMSIEDVTFQVKAAAKEGTPSAQAIARRNATISAIEKKCAADAESRCEVAKLFSGGRYDLYRYKAYSDVRLVFAPEAQLALFGGPRDEVTYLRYGLNIAFLRAYENGKPAETPHYLKWSGEGVNDGDLVFATGDPSATSRLATAAQLTFYRDTELPLALKRLQPAIQAVSAFANKSEDNLRVAEPTLNALLAAYKLAAGKLIGLRDDRLVARKTLFESKIKRAVEADSKLGAEGAKVWDTVATAFKNWTPFEKPYQVLESAPAPGSVLFAVARQLIRQQEPGAPALDVTTRTGDALEIAVLTQYLEELRGLGDKEVPLKNILEGKTPAQAAEAFVKSSKLGNVGERRRLASDPQAVRASSDGMIRLALMLEPSAKRLQKKHEEMIDSLETSASEKIAGYRFRLFGSAEYPDADTTPRVEFGVVKGYTDRAGVALPYASTFSGLFYRRDAQGPYFVPQRWVDLRSSLDVVTPLDFVSTCDIGGGDHGGPVVNRAGELVGVTFDGNLESMPDIYLYSEEQARAVHVAAQGIAEALTKIYKATALLRELGLPAPSAVSSLAPR